MKFVAAVWKLLVGIKDALVLIFMLLFFGALYAILSHRPAPVSDGVLDLALKGAIVEQPSESDPLATFGGSAGPRQYSLRQLRAALLAAKDDGRVKAVALDLDSFMGGGQAALHDVGGALDEVRRRGFARTAEEMSLGTSSLAVPVLEPGRGAVAALGVVVAGGRRDLTRLAPALQVAARAIARGIQPYA